MQRIHLVNFNGFINTLKKYLKYYMCVLRRPTWRRVKYLAKVAPSIMEQTIHHSGHNAA